MGHQKLNFSEKSHHIYFDHNATTPLAAQLYSLVPELLKEWGNPSSIHFSGRGPKNLLRDSRQQLAVFLGVDPLEIVFTSGGSESNNLAIKGVFEGIATGKLFKGEGRNHFIASSVEHPSVVKSLKHLSELGAKVDWLPVNRQGQIDLEVFEKLLTEKTALVSCMYANNETGNVFPIAKMAKMAHKVGALFHCDGVQALGKAYVNLRNWQVDLASFSGHKFYSLKGCGLLYVKKGIWLESLIHGGGQERGRRAGTENVLAIAALAAMADCQAELESRILEMQRLRDKLEVEILREIENVKVTGGQAPRVPNTSSLVIDGIDGETLLMNLDMKGFSVSTGAACSSGNPEPSPVLLNMGLTRREAQSSLRLSLGWGTTEQEVELFISTLKATVARLRSFKHGEQAVYGV